MRVLVMTRSRESKLIWSNDGAQGWSAKGTEAAYEVVPKGKQWEVLVYDGEWPAERLIEGPFASADAAKAAAEANFAARGTA